MPLEEAAKAVEKCDLSKNAEQIIKDAIYKELSRNGQVFILYNRVQSIDEFSLRIKNIAPDARIGIAHGQMGKRNWKILYMTLLIISLIY